MHILGWMFLKARTRVASAAEELESYMTVLLWIVLFGKAELIGIHCGSTVTSLGGKKKKVFIQLFYYRDGAGDCFKMSQTVELFQAAEQTCFLLILPSSIFSPRNHSDRRPSCAMAPGAGAHAEGLPCPGPGGHCCPEGDLSSETAEAWTGPAGVSAAAWCLGAQTGLSDQLWVVSELLTSDFPSCGPRRTVKGMELVLG